MNFKVVCQSTKEREQEIIDLFNKANSLNQAREMIKEHLE